MPTRKRRTKRRGKTVTLRVRITQAAPRSKKKRRSTKRRTTRRRRLKNGRFAKR